MDSTSDMVFAVWLGGMHRAWLISLVILVHGLLFQLALVLCRCLVEMSSATEPNWTVPMPAMSGVVLPCKLVALSAVAAPQSPAICRCVSSMANPGTTQLIA
jgi:hypothetical protein